MLFISEKRFSSEEELIEKVKRDNHPAATATSIQTGFVTRTTGLASTTSRVIRSTGSQMPWCTTLGSFATDESSSYEKNETDPFYIEYIMGNYALGVWGTDTVEFNGVNISQVSFAVVNSTNTVQGILGVGLAGLQTTNRYGYSYENFPMRLKSEGLINKNMYSLYMNEKGSQTGSVLFGAVDHAKYSGTLQTVPLINLNPAYYDEPTSFRIMMNGIFLEGPGFNQTITNIPITGVLDSGSPNTYLPLSVLRRLATMFDAIDRLTWYEVDCDYNTPSLQVVFYFAGVRIEVPMSELVIRYRTTCYLDVFPMPSGSSSYALLGENFLRNAYVVYDLEEVEILLAQAEYTDEEDIEVVTLAIPSAVQAAGYSELSINYSRSNTGTVTVVDFSGLESHILRNLEYRLLGSFKCI